MRRSFVHLEAGAGGARRPPRHSPREHTPAPPSVAVDLERYRNIRHDRRRPTAWAPTYTLPRSSTSSVSLFFDAGARTGPVHIAAEWLPVGGRARDGAIGEETSREP